MGDHQGPVSAVNLCPFIGVDLNYVTDHLIEPSGRSGVNETNKRTNKLTNKFSFQFTGHHFEFNFVNFVD